MTSKLLLLCLMSVFIVSCQTNEKEILQGQIDSLQFELKKSRETTELLTEIGILLDSIDASRQLLRVKLGEGTPYDDYTARMQDLNRYIERTRNQITDLEKSLTSSKASAAAFSRTIKRLKADVEARGKEVAFLQEQVDKYRNENANLIVTVDLQDAEIVQKEAEIEARSQELALIEARVQELMIQSKISEADAYFTRAQAVEIAANRTKLAPRKKKETMKEAVELYKKALSLGKAEARAKITELERRL